MDEEIISVNEKIEIICTGLHRFDMETRDREIQNFVSLKWFPSEQWPPDPEGDKVTFLPRLAQGSSVCQGSSDEERTGVFITSTQLYS